MEKIIIGADMQKIALVLFIIVVATMSAGHYSAAVSSDPVASQNLWLGDRVAGTKIPSQVLGAATVNVESGSQLVTGSPENASPAAEFIPIGKIPAAISKAAAELVDTITIPRIQANLPIVTARTTDAAILHSLLDSGAVLYPGSANFGQIGQTILLGHSAPVNWPNVKHDTAFSRINELEPGDTIDIRYNGTVFDYVVLGTRIIKKGADLPEMVTSGNSVLLVSCWPPGRDRDRIVVQALPQGSE